VKSPWCRCDHLNESFWEILSFGAVYHAVNQNGSYFLSDGNPQVWPFQGKLLSSSCLSAAIFPAVCFGSDTIWSFAFALGFFKDNHFISGSFGNSRKGIWRNVLHQIIGFLLPQTKMEVPGLFARNFTGLFPRHSFSRLLHTGNSFFFSFLIRTKNIKYVIIWHKWLRNRKHVVQKLLKSINLDVFSY